jgi:hypothetical protein
MTLQNIELPLESAEDITPEEVLKRDIFAGHNPISNTECAVYPHVCLGVERVSNEAYAQRLAEQKRREAERRMAAGQQVVIDPAMLGGRIKGH